VNRTIWGILAGLVLGATIVWCVSRPHLSESAKETTRKRAEPSRVIQTNGQTLVMLDRQAQQRAGLKVAELAAVAIKPECQGYGRVVDPAPLAALVAELGTVRAALEASTKEYQRLKLLHTAGQNVSARAFEAAEAALKRDQIAADAGHAKLMSAWGRGIVSQPDLPGFVRSLTDLETALARIDLPLGQALQQPPTSGRIAPLASAEQPVAAELIGPVPVADAQSQGQGFLFLLRRNLLPPGTAVIGWLAVSSEVQDGVIVPRSALVRHEGEAFVYLQVEDELFARKAIALVQPMADGWFVGDGLKPKQKIVVTGAQPLLSEELKGQGGEE